MSRLYAYEFAPVSISKQIITNDLSDECENALFWSIREKHMPIIEYVFNQYKTEIYDVTKFMVKAIETNDLSIVKYIDQIFTLSQIQIEDCLLKSVKGRNVDIITYFFERITSAIRVSPHVFNEIFKSSINEGNVYLFKFLCKKCKDEIISYKDKDALELIVKSKASEDNLLEIIKEFIKTKESLKRSMSSFILIREIFEFVCKNGHQKILDWLYETFPQYKCFDYPLLKIATEYKKVHIVKYFCEEFADTIKTYDYDAIYTVANKNKCHEIVEYIKTKKSDVKKVNINDSYSFEPNDEVFLNCQLGYDDINGGYDKCSDWQKKQKKQMKKITDEKKRLEEIEEKMKQEEIAEKNEKMKLHNSSTYSPYKFGPIITSDPPKAEVISSRKDNKLSNSNINKYLENYENDSKINIFPPPDGKLPSFLTPTNTS